MAQNNSGLLVDVDIESPSSPLGATGDSKNPNKVLTLTGGEDEVNCNSRNIFDAIDTYQTVEDSSIEDVARKRDRINSVDSNNSIRSYDSTEEYSPERCHTLLLLMSIYDDTSWTADAGQDTRPRYADGNSTTISEP